jgi:uncharacterized protein (TIGR02145 family)
LTASKGAFKSSKTKVQYIKVTDEAPTVTDFDGNVYQTVWIGSQLWMSENLKVTHYPNGYPIKFINEYGDWGNIGANNYSDACCYFNYDESKGNGLLYTYAAAIASDWRNDNDVHPTQGICPDGWHLPSDEEWSELVNFVINDGHADDDAVVLKGTSGWDNDGNGTDSYGFNALPGGFGILGMFTGDTHNGYWWSATEKDVSGAYYHSMSSDEPHVIRAVTSKDNVLSVRCVKD